MGERRLLGGRYELDEVVGRGGMAEVYRARDLRLGRVVAVKTLRDDLAGDSTFQERFRREVRSAASLSHPSIIAVYDTGEDLTGEVPVPYLVMEYANGRTLADLLGEGRRLLPGGAVEITDGVLLALGHSHRNGIVHRDIKPSNVMVTEQGDVKVMDFGIARSLTGSQATLTQTSQMIGTAQYMSPEQVRGERVDARSDLYSAGCLLYELLTGRPPFRGESPVAIAYQHAQQAPVPPSHLDPQIPSWADAVVLKAMAKAPAERYQNAEEMRADLRRAMSGVPISRPPAEILPHTPWPGSLVVAAPPDTAIRGRGDRARPPPGHRRRRATLWGLAGVLVLAAVLATGYLMLASGGSGGGSGSGATTYPVPDVRGLTALQAGQKITANHLRPHFLSRSSPSVPKGQVISTRPAAGTVVAADSTVAVFVSAGQHQRAVPDVLGEDVAAARATIAGAGLNLVVKSDTTSTAPADTVVRQSPAAGTPVNPGSDVTIYISAGGTTSGGGTAVREVTGDPAATAETILQGQGFKVRQVKRPGPTSATTGTVYAQHPAGGTVLAPGSTVTIYVQPARALAIVTAPAALSVAQDSAGTVGVTLAAAPASTVTVTVNFTTGNSGLSVSSGGALTFTPADWNTAQDVTITADSSSTGTATFTATAPGYPPAAITVTETPVASGNG
jgi:beta-lactam-binding protein with PASTA domain/tRNA A-37 threonylcarbamoyl transferase component Bud32